MNLIQTLQQIAPLYPAREHLPKDVMTILERLCKIDHTPFDKLYYLAENCTNRYNTNVINTFVEIIKCNATDWQITLINTAREVKYLEDYGQCQSQLFQVLEKCHLIPDSVENLKTQFEFLKEATSRNVQNLQQAIAVQQSYTSNLCTHINSILNQLTSTEEQIQQLNYTPNTEQDTVQLNAPEFNPDMDGLIVPQCHSNNTVIDHTRLAEFTPAFYSQCSTSST